MLDQLHATHTFSAGMSDYQGLCLILFIATLIAVFVAMFDQIGPEADE